MEKRQDQEKQHSILKISLQSAHLENNMFKSNLLFSSQIEKNENAHSSNVITPGDRNGKMLNTKEGRTLSQAQKIYVMISSEFTIYILG